MMENLLFSYISRLTDLIDWTGAKVASYLNIEHVKITLQPFKLLDDDNFKQLMLQLATAEKASYTTLFNEYGIDFGEELENIKTEKVEAAKKEVETAYDIDQARTMAARDKGALMKDDEEYKTLLMKAQGVASQLMAMDDLTRMDSLGQLKTQDYAMYVMASSMIDQFQEAQAALPDPETGKPGQPGAKKDKPAEDKPKPVSAKPPADDKGDK
jgi:hypothetical protein